MDIEQMFPKGASPEDALRASIDALREIISLYDRLGLMFPAVHAAAALHAAYSALADEIGIAESNGEAQS